MDYTERDFILYTCINNSQLLQLYRERITEAVKHQEAMDNYMADSYQFVNDLMNQHFADREDLIADLVATNLKIIEHSYHLSVLLQIFSPECLHFFFNNRLLNLLLEPKYHELDLLTKFLFAHSLQGENETLSPNQQQKFL